VSWTTNEPTIGRVEYGETVAYEIGFIDDTFYQNNHSIQLNGLTNNTTYHFRLLSTDQAGFVTASSDATFTLTEGPLIDVWYGPIQTFGHIGVPQKWVNILGNVSDPDGLSKFSFTLNGGTAQDLSIGPYRRLEEQGDFNVEIDYSDLLNGINLIEISAIDSLGNISSKIVEVNYLSGNVWPLNFSIDWSNVSKIENVAQIVDGLWNISVNSLRPVNTGYDRIVVVGDVSWTDYEVLVPITIHDFDTKGFLIPNSNPAVGLILKWPGHSNWSGDQQPSWGYYPIGGGGWYELNADGTGQLSLTDFVFSSADPLNRSLLLEVTYLWKVRVETLIGGNSMYSLKVWESTLDEPEEWELVVIDNRDVAGGSLAIVAHYVDATFGSITINPLP
jgi:hypothetical protein